jgi:hypothetical protein
MLAQGERPLLGPERRVSREGKLDSTEEVIVTLARLFVRHEVGPGNETKREARLAQSAKALEVLDEIQVRFRGRLYSFDGRSPRSFVGVERGRDVGPRHERISESDTVFHGHLGSGTDGEVRGMGRVADNAASAVVPSATSHGPESTPSRALLSDEAPAVEVASEVLLEVGDRDFDGGIQESGAA